MCKRSSFKLDWSHTWLCHILEYEDIEVLNVLKKIICSHIVELSSYVIKDCKPEMHTYEVNFVINYIHRKDVESARDLVDFIISAQKYSWESSKYIHSLEHNHSSIYSLNHNCSFLFGISMLSGCLLSNLVLHLS